jgi:hypothetical protein
MTIQTNSANARYPVPNQEPDKWSFEHRGHRRAAMHFLCRELTDHKFVINKQSVDQELATAAKQVQESHRVMPHMRRQ